MNPKVGGSSPPQVETFSVSKTHFHKNTRSCVENECCCPRTVNISNVNFTSNYFFLPCNQSLRHNCYHTPFRNSDCTETKRKSRWLLSVSDYKVIKRDYRSVRLGKTNMDFMSSTLSHQSVTTYAFRPSSLQWRHNEYNGVSNHRRFDYLFNRLFRLRSKKTPKLRATGLCEGNPPVTGGFPSQRKSNAENIPLALLNIVWPWKRHSKSPQKWCLNSCSSVVPC